MYAFLSIFRVRSKYANRCVYAKPTAKFTASYYFSLYELKTFSDKAELDRNGFILTHHGKCGLCSTLADLSIYRRWRF